MSTKRGKFVQRTPPCDGKLCGKPKHCRCERDKVSRSSTSRKDHGTGEVTRIMKYAYNHWFDYFSSEAFISTAGGRHGVSSVTTHRSRRYPNTYRALSFASFLPKGAQELVGCQTWINLEGKKGKEQNSFIQNVIWCDEITFIQNVIWWVTTRDRRHGLTKLLVLLRCWTVGSRSAWDRRVMYARGRLLSTKEA
mgnify:CR=1 FL=1